MKNRPLSPHLQIYRPQITSMLSILHRITGFGLAAGVVLLTWGLLAAAAGEDSYAVFYGFCKSIVGQVMLFGWTFAFLYHLFNGIRHLVWDTGRGFDLKTASKSGWAVVVASLLFTALFWCKG